MLFKQRVTHEQIKGIVLFSVVPRRNHVFFFTCRQPVTTKHVFVDRSAIIIVENLRPNRYRTRHPFNTTPRFALFVFGTAGDAEVGGIVAFTSVQELAGLGGLQTHATDEALWTAAAQARIVDVDRWVVAAVLCQVIDAVGMANARGAMPPNLSRRGFSGAAAGERLERDSLDKQSVVLTEAKSLWKELCNEAFLSVLGRSSRGSDRGRTAELGPASTALNLASPTPAGEEQRKGSLALPRKMSEELNDAGQHRRNTYNVLQSDSKSFDFALMRMLALAGRNNAGLGLAAVTQASAETGSGSLDSGSANLESTESILLHNFIIAGFADGSGLGVRDIVDTVSTRRQRILSAAATTAVASGGRCPSRVNAEKDSADLFLSNKSQHHACGPPQLSGLSQGNRRRLVPAEPPNGEEGAAGHTKRREVSLSEGNGDSVSAGDAAVSVPMASKVDASFLFGIPVELRELFRAAALAKMLRPKQQQHRKEREEVS